MKIVRLFAAFLPALVICLSLSGHAHAQRTPTAAPTGDAAQSEPLAAPTANVDVTQAGGDTAPSAIGSISVINLFMRADLLVKAVMILLLIASLWSWTIIINKSLALSTLKRRASKFEKIFWSGRSLDDLYQQFSAKPDHPMVAVFIAALREWRRAFEGGTPKDAVLAGVKERIDKAMSVTIIREVDASRASLGFWQPSAHCAVRRLVRNCVGHHEFVLGHRGTARYDAGRGGAGHCRSAVRNRYGPARGDPGGDFL